MAHRLTKTGPSKAAVSSNVPDNTISDIETVFQTGTNTCDKKKLDFQNVDCIHTPGPQAGANVTKGYVGGMNVSVTPNTNPYWSSSMCPVK